MALTKEKVDIAIDEAKVLAGEKIEDIKEVAMPRLAELIEKNEKNGLQYSAGKFHVKYANDEHFQLEFEMYFKDADGKWHKVANESEQRDFDLLEAGAAKTLKALKIVTFPIEVEEK